MLMFEPRPQINRRVSILSPFIAVFITMVCGAIIFSALGYDGIGAVIEIFFSPILNPLKWQDLLVKSSPLIIIALGLSVGFRANVWNIGAEGQYVFGALAATGVALLTWGMEGVWIMPSIIIAGVLGGMVYAAIPALLKTRLGVSEILTSLMMTYIAIHLLNYLMNGPWKDPMGFNFPQTRLFTDEQTLPKLISGTIIHAGVPFAFLFALLFWVLMSKSLFGFQIRLAGDAPRAANYAGFNAKRTIILSMLIGGGMAGLAGTLEALGPFGQMVPQFPTNYGFIAIIVAFLGRLNPLGIIFAGLIMAITYVGGEVAQTSLGLPSAASTIFQSMTLFFLLGVDIFSRYRLVLRRSHKAKVTNS